MKPEILIIGILIVILPVIIKYFVKHKFRLTDEVIDWNEMENQFFVRFREGVKPYKLLDIYTPMDIMLIESLFLSENIPYHIDFKYFMGVRPFIPIINYTNSNLYILEEDYDDAIFLIHEYINTKRLEKYKENFRVRNFFEIIVGGWLVYNPQEILGITVYQRKI